MDAGAAWSRDEGLRRRAEALLATSAPELAAEALGAGLLLRAAEATTWEGTLGQIRGVRVVLVVPAGLAARLEASPSSVDAVTRALAAAVSETPGEMLLHLEMRTGDVPPHGGPSGAPYRSA